MEDSKESSWFEMDLPYDPAIPFLEIYPNENKSAIHCESPPMFTAAQLTMANLWNQPRAPSTGGWTKQMW